MSKAILLFDKMPKHCGCCDFSIEEDGIIPFKCFLTGQVSCFDKRPDWCPLKELPEHNVECLPIDWTSGNSYNRGEQKGWNNCLDMIEGKGD